MAVRLDFPRLVPGVAACPPVHPLGTWLMSETWKSSPRDRREGRPLSLPFTFVFLNAFLGSRQVTFPEGAGEKLLLISNGTNCMDLPSPFFLLFPPRTMITFLMRILFKKYSSVFPAPSQDLFSFVPIPFFPSSELHIFLVTSPGWSNAWFFLLPVASWQVAADPAVDRGPGPAGGRGGGGAWRKR